MEWELDDKVKRKLEEIANLADVEFPKQEKLAPDASLKDVLEQEVGDFCRWCKDIKHGFDPELAGIKVYSPDFPMVSEGGTLTGY